MISPVSGGDDTDERMSCRGFHLRTDRAAHKGRDHEVPSNPMHMRGQQYSLKVDPLCPAVVTGRRLTDVAAGGGAVVRAEALAALVSTSRSHMIRCR